MTFLTLPVSVKHTLNSTSTDRWVVNFQLQSASSPIPTGYLINIVLLFIDVLNTVDDGLIQIGITNSSLIQFTTTYKSQHYYSSPNSYSLNLFINTMPCLLSIVEMTSMNFTVKFNSLPPQQTYITYILVQRIFTSKNIFVIFNFINETARNYELRIIQDGYLNPSDSNYFQGLVNVSVHNTQLKLRRKFTIQGRYVKVGFNPTNSLIQNLNASCIFFNPAYNSCPYNYFLTYSNNIPFVQIPSSCLPCHFTCQTCTSSDNDLTYTDQRFCTSCPIERRLNSSQKRYGKCLCPFGITQSSSGICQSCSFNCLQFNVHFMKSSTAAVFLLVFTFGDLQFDGTSFQQNLKVFINQIPVSTQQVKNSSPGVYKINLRVTDLQTCSKQCNVSFKFSQPYKIKHRDIFLTKQFSNLTIQDYFFAQQNIPKQLSQAFSISSKLIALSSSAGQASLIKMLFQLQQMIDVHKYLNLQIPILFKQFVQALASFRFMDLTTVIPYDINSIIKSASGDELDCKGSPKIVYYENGVNFYKNMVVVVVSIAIIIAINFLVYLLLRLIPLQISQIVAQKLRVRWLVSLSDNIQTMVIPISIFAFFQLSYTTPSMSYLWIYFLAHFLIAFIFLFPFFVAAYVRCFMKTRFNQKLNQHEIQIKIDLYQDIMQDCSINFQITYVFYIYNYMRKFFYGLILSSFLSGFFQIFLLILVNFIQLCMTFYMILNRIFKSKAKIICRTINLVSLLVIQILILYYNFSFNNYQGKLLVGTSCTYLAIISTGLGLIQLVLKIGEIIFQKIRSSSTEQKEQQRQPNYVKNKNNEIIQCKIGVENTKYDQNSSDDNSKHQTNSQKQHQYKDPIIIDKNQRKIKFQLANIEQQGEENKEYIINKDETRSDNSQIHIIQPTDSWRKPNYNKQTIDYDGYYKRPTQRPRKKKNNFEDQINKKKNVFANYDKQRHFRSASTREEDKDKRQYQQNEKDNPTNKNKLQTLYSNQNQMGIEIPGRQRAKKKMKKTIQNKVNSINQPVSVNRTTKQKKGKPKITLLEQYIDKQSSMSDIAQIAP